MICPVPGSSSAYHADRTAVSHSALERFRAAPEDYRAWFTGEVPGEETKDLRIGRILHTLALEPHLFAVDFSVCPDVDRRTTEGKRRHKVWLEELGDRTGCYSDEYELAVRLAEALWENDRAAQLLMLPGWTECALYWTCPETGIRCKCRPDHLTNDYCIDLKGLANPSKQVFGAVAGRLGYHRQAAWYLEGIRLCGGTTANFVFAVVGKSRPHKVRIYDLDDDALALGHRQNMADLQRLKRCREANDWLAPEAKHVTTIELPRYSFYEDDDG